MKMPHTGAPRGKWVRVKLKDGTVIIDRFHDRTDKYVFLKKHGRIAKSTIQAFSDYKERNDGKGDKV